MGKHVTSQITSRSWLGTTEQVCPDNQRLQAERIACVNLGQLQWPRFSPRSPGAGWAPSELYLVAFSSVPEVGQLTPSQIYFFLSQSHIGECCCLPRVASQVLISPFHSLSSQGQTDSIFLVLPLRRSLLVEVP